MCYGILTGNTMCWLMKTSVLFLLLLQCSHGITVTPTSFAASLAFTTVLQLTLSPTVQSANTGIMSMLATS